MDDTCCELRRDGGGVCRDSLRESSRLFILSSLMTSGGRRPFERNGIYSTFVIVALLIAVAYLAYWGIIGIRTPVQTSRQPLESARRK